MHYEVRYEDSRGRYTEETFASQQSAIARQRALEPLDIEAEVWEVSKGPNESADE